MGNPKLEPCIQMIFLNADKERARSAHRSCHHLGCQDGDGLLSLQDIQSMLPEVRWEAKANLPIQEICRKKEVWTLDLYRKKQSGSILAARLIAMPERRACPLGVTTCAVALFFSPESLDWNGFFVFFLEGNCCHLKKTCPPISKAPPMRKTHHIHQIVFIRDP